MNEGPNQKGMIKSDETLLSIIEILRDLDGAGVTEVANSLGIAKSAVHKHLKTLVHHGYATKHEQEYKLGFEFLVLGGKVRNSNELCQRARPKVYELADELGIASTFSVASFDYEIITYRANQLSLDVKTHIGSRSPLHQSARGKAILASLPDHRINNFVERTELPPATPQTVTDPEDLWVEVEQIRSDGFATSIEEGADGKASVGVAIEDPASQTVGALSITCPVTRDIRSKLETQYSERLLQAVSEIRYLLHS
ncbi:IclR family transcriptional regulator domain-containing protein [Halobellus sp. GM3]|uniref:IclR family transcriptional regulator domain-containing protein n=1 Tax=Halobellus sp. GM3 TaxID=3458410 RepID=UPI00403DA844